MGNKSSKKPPMTTPSNGDTANASHSIDKHHEAVRLRSKPCPLAARDCRTLTAVSNLTGKTRPLSTLSVPSSTIHSDTKLVIEQLCSKQPKYCLLKQIDFEQLDERIQFLLFEAACDQLDQLSTIQRLKSAQTAQIPTVVQQTATKTSSDNLEQIATDYRQLCGTFMASSLPELLLLSGCQPEELYTWAHKILIEMLRQAEKLWQSKVDALTCSLLGCGLSSIDKSACRTVIRRQVEKLICSTAVEVSATVRWSSLLSEDTLKKSLITGQHRISVESLGSATRGFLNETAAWCWRAACISCSNASFSLAVLVRDNDNDEAKDSGLQKFDPRLHRTVIGPEQLGALVDCVLWPALCQCKRDQQNRYCSVLCKAVIKLR